MSGGGLVYVFCILSGDAAVSLEGIPGMEPERPPRAIRAGGVQAVASEVGPDFSEEALNASIRDLDWLSPRAVRHHEVVDTLFERAKLLLPLTFGAIFTSEASLRQRLEAQSVDLGAALERLRGREQWDLKLTRDEARFMEALRQHSAPLRQMAAELAAKPPGTRFLLEKKLKTLEAGEARRLGAAIRTDVHEVLSARAVEAHRDELPASPSQPVRLELRSAYLVEEAASDGLKLAIAELLHKYGSLGYGFDLTGPWPAFTFARGVREALA